jgi:hypothetical protein
MRLSELEELTHSLIKNYPEYKEDFLDLYQYAIDEIAEGGSEQHECELSYGSMMEIIKDYDYDDPSDDLRKEEEYNWRQEQIRKEIDEK